MDLVICAFLTKACDCIIVSSVSLGKISVGVARRRLRITFYRAADLVRTLTEARRENAHLKPGAGSETSAVRASIGASPPQMPAWSCTSSIRPSSLDRGLVRSAAQ